MNKSYKLLAVATLIPSILVPAPAASATVGDPDNPQRPPLAPLLNANVPNRIPGEYIVVFKASTKRDVALTAQKAVEEKIARLGGAIKHRYTSTLTGFSAKLPERALLALRAEPSVDYLEVNQRGQLNTSQPPNPPASPPTGLARTSKRVLPLPDPLAYTYSETGSGVQVYVIDTGIRATHLEFGGRVSGGMNVANMNDADTGDCNAHGTQVAGIIGGATVGIAKNVILHPVRANGSGTSGSGCGDTKLDLVIKAVDWIITEKNAGRLSPPAVVNLSTSFQNDLPGCSTNVPNDHRCITTLDRSVGTSIESGITYVLAAGNYAQKDKNSPVDACAWSPARINQSSLNRAIVVGAIDPSNDRRWSKTSDISGSTIYEGSNVGRCLSLFAPGVGLKTAFPASNTSMSDPAPPGTSFAAAHVTGVVARYLQTHPTASPPKVWEALHLANNHAGTSGWGGVGDAGTNSPNEMLHYGPYNDGRDDHDLLPPPAPTNLIVR